MKKKLLTIISSAIILVAAGSVFFNPTVSAVNYAKKALQYVSARYGTQIESLALVNEGYANYPLSDRQLWCAKILDQKTGAIFGAYIDEVGKVIDIKSIKENEKLEYLKNYGKLEKALYKRLLNVQPQETLKVGIWLKSTDTPIPRPDNTVTKSQFNEAKAKRQSTYRSIQEDITTSVKAKGSDILYASRYAPLIFAELSKDAILEIESRSDVDCVYLSATYQPEINTAAYTDRADFVWSCGIDGSGVNIAVVEGDGIEFANPYLATGSYYDAANPRIGDHATAIAGIIASTHDTYQGIAHGAPGILSGNARSYSDADIIAANEWALDNGARIINHSWGRDTNLQMGPMDRYLDHVFIHDAVTVVKSAGNRGGGDGDVTSPGLGWNTITVGATDDMDNSDWQDDVMAPYSSWGDPISPHGDREKPEVAAVGSRMRSTLTSSPWVGSVGDGTSYAAPQVAAEAALLMQAQWWLQFWPETVKATIMASALHNIEGSSRLSDHDGAGAIDISNAYDTVKNNQIDAVTLYPDSGSQHYTFHVDAGERVRVAIAWDSHPDTAHPPTTDVLQADFDLMVYNPTNNLVTWSFSWDNSYEIVDFIASESGTYRAVVSPYRFDGDYEYLGIAWSKSYTLDDAWTYGGYGTARASMGSGECYISLVSWLGTGASGASRIGVEWTPSSNCRISVEVHFTVRYKIWSNWFFGIAWIHVTGWIYPEGQPLLESYNYHANSVSFGGSGEYSGYIEGSHDYGSTLQGGTTYEIWIGFEAYAGNLAGIEGYAGAEEAYLDVQRIIITTY